MRGLGPVNVKSRPRAMSHLSLARARGNDLSVVSPACLSCLHWEPRATEERSEGHNIILIITTKHNIRPILLIRNSHRVRVKMEQTDSPHPSLIRNTEAPVVTCHTCHTDVMTVCTHQASLSHAVASLRVSSVHVPGFSS